MQLERRHEMNTDQRVERLEVDMIDVKTRLAVAESNIKDIKESLTTIKSNTTWLLRLVGGAIIGAILALVFKGGI
jgi:hypothetical protein